jgi:hypothetical protein
MAIGGSILNKCKRRSELIQPNRKDLPIGGEIKEPDGGMNTLRGNG